MRVVLVDAPLRRRPTDLQRREQLAVVEQTVEAVVKRVGRVRIRVGEATNHVDVIGQHHRNGPTQRRIIRQEHACRTGAESKVRKACPR